MAMELIGFFLGDFLSLLPLKGSPVGLLESLAREVTTISAVITMDVVAARAKIMVLKIEREKKMGDFFFPRKFIFMKGIAI
jgi:hypothetical protein